MVGLALGIGLISLGVWLGFILWVVWVVTDYRKWKRRGRR